MKMCVCVYVMSITCWPNCNWWVNVLENQHSPSFFFSLLSCSLHQIKIYFFKAKENENHTRRRTTMMMRTKERAREREKARERMKFKELFRVYLTTTTSSSDKFILNVFFFDDVRSNVWSRQWEFNRSITRTIYSNPKEKKIFHRWERERRNECVTIV